MSSNNDVKVADAVRAQFGSKFSGVLHDAIVYRDEVVCEGKKGCKYRAKWMVKLSSFSFPMCGRCAKPNKPNTNPNRTLSPLPTRPTN